jgi:hypothetical protein
VGVVVDEEAGRYQFPADPAIYRLETIYRFLLFVCVFLALFVCMIFAFCAFNNDFFCVHFVAFCVHLFFCFFCFLVQSA